jgi:tetratricopeptide (TPR) repeat protein
MIDSTTPTLAVIDHLIQQGDLDTAATLLQQLLARDPYQADLLRRLATVQQQRGQAYQAARLWRQAIAAAPQPDASDYHHLALAYISGEQFNDAAKALQQVLRIDPQHSEAAGQLGAVYLKQERYQEGLAQLQQALSLQPTDLTIRTNLASALRECGQLTQALALLEQIVADHPTHAVAWTNLGDVCSAIPEQRERAAACFERALALDAEDASALHNQALRALAQGHLATGWEMYEARKRLHPNAHRRYSYPHWQGEPLTGRSILVYAEQGVGDEILFANCLPDVISQAGQVIIDCDPRLVPLFERSFPQAMIWPVDRASTQPPPQLRIAVDYQCAAGSLPRLLRRTVADFPAHEGYLQPDPERVTYWRQRLATLGAGCKVGVAWRSGLRSARRDTNYSDLSVWGPLFALVGYQFVIVQYGDCADELAQAREQFPWAALVYFEDIDLRNDFDDCAALYQALDLIIAPNTAITALAGALGVRTWVLGGGWWLHGQPQGAPWYPSVRMPTVGSLSAAKPTTRLLMAAVIELADSVAPAGMEERVGYWREVMARCYRYKSDDCSGLAHAVMQRSQQLANTEFVRQALMLEQQVQSSNPDWLGQALLYGQLGEWEQVERCIEQGYAADPQAQDYYAQVAWMQIGMKW